MLTVSPLTFVLPAAHPLAVEALTSLHVALAGIALVLFATHTTFNVPSLMGTIMCIGVATSNSILVITFANQRRLLGDDATMAALAFVKLRALLAGSKAARTFSACCKPSKATATGSANCKA